jgi:uncharacterized protein YigA (DUF484 family)
MKQQSMTDMTAINADLILDEQLVKDYLLANPQFFIHNPDVLQTIRLPHQERGVVSLVERQQELLRAKVQVLEEEITQLMSVARQNEGIFLTFSELYLQIIKAGDESTLYQAMLDILSDKLNLPAIYLKSFADDGQAFHIKKAEVDALLEHRLMRNDYYFGRLNVKEQKLLFADNTDIKSAALMLLGDEGEVGLVAFGSTDENHFFPGMDILFLKELRKILALMLNKFR